MGIALDTIAHLRQLDDLSTVTEETIVTVRDRTLTAGTTTITSNALGILGALTLATLTWVGANIYIPFQPVPFTLQTLFVLLSGSVVARRYGTLGQLTYVGAGALGLPVFAGSSAGWAIITGPTGGYLLSFLIAPALVSLLLSRSRGLVNDALAFVAGTVVIFLFGVTHLALFYTHDAAAAISLGLIPFIPGAVVKIAAAMSIHRSYRALSSQITRSRSS
jgi:biotin transport system substrate-specific component